jgi:hypothetical protein
MAEEDLPPDDTDDKIIDLSDRADSRVDAVISTVQKDLKAAGDDVFAIQLANGLRKLLLPAEFPGVENVVAGAIGVGPQHIDSAALPKLYQTAVSALQECARVDEAIQWESKAAAIATYARQAKDERLLQAAIRIRLRAIRRCGELLEEIKGSRGRPKQIGAPVHTNFSETPSRAQVAAEANLTRNQMLIAVRFAHVPSDAFEAAVEATRPATITSLARRGTRPATPNSPFVKGEFTIYGAYQHDRGATLEEIATERSLAALMSAWRNANPEAQRRFLEILGLKPPTT